MPTGTAINNISKASDMEGGKTRCFQGPTLCQIPRAKMKINEEY